MSAFSSSMPNQQQPTSTEITSITNTGTANAGTSDLMNTPMSSTDNQMPSTGFTTDNTTSTGQTSTTDRLSSTTSTGDRMPSTMTPTDRDRYPTTTSTGDRYPSTMSTADRFPSTNDYNNNGNTYMYNNEVRPQTYDGNMKPDYSYPPRYPNKYNYYQDIYPMHTDGSSYMSNDGYGQKVPTTYYYGPGVSTSSSMQPDRDGQSAKPYMGNGWSNADEMHRRKQGSSPPPPPSSSTNVYGGNNNADKYPPGKYNKTQPPSSVPHIRTYFNPDDYLYTTKSEYNNKQTKQM